MSYIPSESQITRLISSRQVKDYLLEHPDFFTAHQELLEQLKVPHPSGVAVSLVTKQVEVLRKKNQLLEHNLNDLVQIARHNDQLFERMHKLTLALFASPTLDDAIDNLVQVLYDEFLADFVTLRLIQPGKNSRFPDLYVDPSDGQLTSFEKILKNQRPFCGRIKLIQSTFLFRTDAELVESCAIVPFRSSSISGLLAIGSRDEERFQPGMGHLFLENMGELTSLGLTSLLQKDPG